MVLRDLGAPGSESANTAHGGRFSLGAAAGEFRVDVCPVDGRWRLFGFSLNLGEPGRVPPAPSTLAAQKEPAKPPAGPKPDLHVPQKASPQAPAGKAAQASRWVKVCRDSFMAAAS